MSNTARIAATAANTLVKPLNVEDVFSTYLYTGNGSTQTITNGIDLAGEGGLVWIKARGEAYDHMLYDTERGALYDLNSNQTAASALIANSLTSFNSDGFSVGSYSRVNNGGTQKAMASWTFRKAPKFFDVVEFQTGASGTDTVISHNLGSTPGFVITKMTSTTSGWFCFHTSRANKYIQLNTTGAEASWTWTADSAEIDLGTFWTTSFANQTGIAYLFAHNDGDGEFGPDGDADIIKCGSFTTDGSGVADVNLGFEPAWLLTKASSTSSYWALMDEMRGFGADVGMDYMVQPNTSNAEVGPNYLYKKNATGFSTASLSANQTYIYIAIRRGPMAVPESATDVFAIDNSLQTSPQFVSGFPVDMSMTKNTVNGTGYIGSRLTQGSALVTYNTNAEYSNAAFAWDFQDGWITNFYGSSSSFVYSHMWRRAPGFFDVVAYTGNGTAGRTVSHNLGVAPEMIWVKNRTTAGTYWGVYHADLGNQEVLFLNDNQGDYTSTSMWGSTTPTDTQFTVGTYANIANQSGASHIAYLFATLDGVSKVGSVSHTTGSNTDVDCGFSAGARFVILKGTHASGWQVFDTERGIVTGNDPTLTLHSSSAEDSSQDRIDPYSSGFSIGPDIATGTFIYYAIA